ncbi:hypothetical protein E4T52_16120 [Aureobasidium sp. EXF-3400]|nr:hypothetical protein E4T52_16120 [Aureobasidium sp. EXF-3400]
MSTIMRTLRNLRSIGLKEYGHQMQVRPPLRNLRMTLYERQLTGSLTAIVHGSTGDTKAGTLIGQDRYGNKYYENMEDLPLRTRWCDYKDQEFNPDQIEPGWYEILLES